MYQYIVYGLYIYNTGVFLRHICIFKVGANCVSDHMNAMLCCPNMHEKVDRVKNIGSYDTHNKMQGYQNNV